MIIIGYPGIGKTTYANSTDAVIDLESSNFNYNGNKIEHWVEVYCNVAADLSSQGNHVFVSSHALVQKELLKRKKENPDFEPIGAIIPAFKLRDQWIQKLKDRFDSTGLNKDLRAYERAKEYFVYDITDIIGNDDIIFVEIQDMKYDMLHLIEALQTKLYKNFKEVN